jgi:transposase
MAKPILDDELWALIEPLLPPPKPRRSRYPGRKPLDDRALLTGILFILQTGLRWDLLPREMGCGSGMSCWRRLRDWQAAGVWDRLHEVLLAKLRAADQIDWSRVVVDSSSIRAVGPGQKRDRIPRTARDPVQSTTSSLKRRASRSRQSSRAPTATMLPSFTHCLTPSRPLPASAAGRSRSLALFRATGATITTNTVVRYTQPASRLKSPDAASHTAAG